MTENDVYKFYNDYVKVVYSEIEARNNSLPVELLFEIHSAFDHLKRFHIGGLSEQEAAGKAYGHLKRGILDAFKLKLKYFNKEYQKFSKKKADLRIIDSGKFLPAMLHDKTEIIDTAKKARLSEGNASVEEAFENWYKVSLMIDSFEEKYFNPEKISWATKQSFFRFLGNFVIGLTTGIIGSVIVYFFTR